MRLETLFRGQGNRAEIKSERTMINGVQSTLDFSQEVPFGQDPSTGIDVRNGGPVGRERKNALAVYPVGSDDTKKMYLRTMETGGFHGNGTSVRAYVDRKRTGRREGQYVNVTTDYQSKDDPEFNRSKGSKTRVTVYDGAGKVIREREHKSGGVGLSPLVTKIVTHGIDAQVKKIKDGKKQSK